MTTRRGDGGETSLADGSSTAKTSDTIHAIGAVDELNSFLALFAAQAESAPFKEITGRLQQELFDLGAHLATVGATPVPQVDWLETEVARLNDALPPLTEFVIPGGSEANALAHVCRTVCRRAERHSWAVAEADEAARYLNRLSDLFFVIARTLSAGEEDQWRGSKDPAAD
ncbi:MAG: cob(I)yrinic acid a,c-diamide adenosyltransferase [Pseudomonadota bacterium]